MEQKVNALMLRAADYKENDKILTLLTAELGKITVGIRGVKKAGAKLKFAVQPFCFAEYMLVKRGDKYTVTGCSETESFYDLRTDIMKFYAASAAAEAALALTYEGDECREIFRALIDAYTEMCSGNECSALIRFLVCALGVSGYALSAEYCPRCGKDLLLSDNLRFDMPSGAFSCSSCGDGLGASRVTLNVIRRAQGKSFRPDLITADGMKRALRLLREYFSYKTDGRLNALEEYIRLFSASTDGQTAQ